MNEHTLLTEAVETALFRIQAVRQVYAVTPTSRLAALVARLPPLEGTVITASSTGEPPTIEASIGLNALQPAASTALHAVHAIRAALDETGRTDVAVRVRIVSID